MNIIYKMTHAWYSKKQADVNRAFPTTTIGTGCTMWQHKDGHIVRSSIVSTTMDHGCNTDVYDDLVYLGQVVTFIGVSTD